MSTQHTINSTDDSSTTNKSIPIQQEELREDCIKAKEDALDKLDDDCETICETTRKLDDIPIDKDFPRLVADKVKKPIKEQRRVTYKPEEFRSLRKKIRYSDKVDRKTTITKLYETSRKNFYCLKLSINDHSQYFRLYHDREIGFTENLLQYTIELVRWEVKE